MYCERCNIDFPESLRYCKWCGQHLTRRAQATTRIRRCHSCGRVVKSAWSYCRSCGAQLAATAVQPEVICSGCKQVVEPPGLICRVCGLEVPQEGDPDADLIAALDTGPTNYAYCASCGVRLDPQTNRCPKCGLPVTRRQLVSDALQTCPICKTQNRRGTGICEGCGAALSLDATTGADLAVRAATGPTTLPDVPVTSSGRSGFGEKATRDGVEAQSSGGDQSEVTTVSYTEILSSWTPEQAASSERAVIPDTPATQGGFSGESSQQNLAEGSIDEFKTNVMYRVDLTEPDNVPTESLPTGSLSGSRPTSVFGASDLPFDPARAAEGALAEDSARASGEGSPNDNWVVTAHEFTDMRTQPVETPDATVPIGPANTGLTPENGALEMTKAETQVVGAPVTGEGAAIGSSQPAGQGGEAAPDWLLRGELMPPRTEGLAGPDAVAPPAGLTPPADTGAPPIGTAERAADASRTIESTTPLTSLSAPNESAASIVATGPSALPTSGAPSVPTHSRQVPPEVAHYMAYMDRQSAPQAPGPASHVASPTQPAPSQKSRLLLIAAVTGSLALAMLAGLAYFIFRFQQGQKSTVTTSTSEQPTTAIDTPPATTPRPIPTPTTQEVAAPEGMVVVPSGTYIIGRDNGDPLAGPKHTATLPSFVIDKTEVTNAEYKRFVDATGHASPGPWREHAFPEGKGNYPVTDVTWQDATDYAAWAGKRLPTEAEWEAAARGKAGRIFPWGNEWRSDAANIGTTGITEVGRFPEGASTAGALDMIGNVWEWTADEFKLYPGNGARLRDLVEPGIVYRVIRGGAYDGSKKHDASYRGYVDGSKSYPRTGFRCVRSAEKP